MSGDCGRGERGQGALEYVGLVVLVAAVAAGLIAVGLPGKIPDAYRSAVCAIARDAHCDSAQPRRGDAEHAEGTPVRDGGAPAAAEDGGNDDDGGPLSAAWDGISTAASTVGHAFKGAGEQAWEAGKGLVGGVRMLACTVHICGHERFKQTWSGYKKLVTDPVESLTYIWDQSTKGIRDDWNNGRKAEAVGRTPVAVLSFVFGGKGISKLGKLSKLDKVDSPGRPKDGSRSDSRVLACGARNSFLPGTRVLLPGGGRDAINDVDIGDRVVATDPFTGRTVPRSVTDVIVGHGRKHLIDIVVDTEARGGRTSTLTATDGHLFWINGQRRWVEAGELSRGMHLRTADGTPARVVQTREYTRNQRVYNLTVAGVHTYYVVSAGHGILVHNESCLLNNPQELRGVSWDVARSKIDRFIAESELKWQGPLPLKKGDGVRWYTKEGDFLALERGNTGVEEPLHRGPYVKIATGGKNTRIPLEGNPTLS